MSHTVTVKLQGTVQREFEEHSLDVEFEFSGDPEAPVRLWTGKEWIQIPAEQFEGFVRIFKSRR